MVSMIPFGLLAGFAGEREVRITELDDTGFCFRIGKKYDEEYGKKEKHIKKHDTQYEQSYDEKIRFSGLKVCFYDMEYEKYNEVKILEYEVQKLAEESTDFFVKYKVTVNQEDYVQAVQKLLFQYNKYIQLKLEDDDSVLAKSMTGYPGELDVVKCDSLEAQAKIWWREITCGRGSTYGSGNTCGSRSTCDSENTCNRGVMCNSEATFCSEKIYQTELALELDRPELYQDYLHYPLAEFSRRFAKRSVGVCREILTTKETPDRLYIGNQFCHLLFPDREILFQMMKKALSEQVEITIAFSYVREHMLDYVRDLLQQIDDWCEKNRKCVEIIVNDWGMAEMLGKDYKNSNEQKYGNSMENDEKNGMKNLIPCLGNLLNKRKKDPRILYKKGDQKLFEWNSLNAGFYRDFLEKEYGIRRLEWESIGYKQQLPTGKNSLHIPFYQTNTSQYCPLRAVCENGERGCRKFEKECPGYCGKYALLYPEHLHMLGRYNSLFGIDMGILKKKELLESYIENDVDRVVISIL